MMVLKRGGNLVVGLTDENLRDLWNGKVLRIRGSEIAVPGMAFYFVHGKTDEQMRADLIANGYDIEVEPISDLTQ